MVNLVVIPAASGRALSHSMLCLHGSLIQAKANSLWKCRSIKLEENKIWCSVRFKLICYTSISLQIDLTEGEAKSNIKPIMMEINLGSPYMGSILLMTPSPQRLLP